MCLRILNVKYYIVILDYACLETQGCNKFNLVDLEADLMTKTGWCQNRHKKLVWQKLARKRRWSTRKMIAVPSSVFHWALWNQCVQTSWTLWCRRKLCWVLTLFRDFSQELCASWWCLTYLRPACRHVLGSFVRKYGYGWDASKLMWGKSKNELTVRVNSFLGGILVAVLVLAISPAAILPREGG